MKFQTILFFATFLALLIFAQSCEKDPEIITETVTVTDTVFVNSVDTVFLTITDTLTLTEFIQDSVTTFFLVRHAETSGSGNDPVLSSEGMERADELMRILGNVELDAIYSTNYNRTMQTASPVADDQALNVEMYGGFDLDTVSDEILTTFPSGKILVVGHSNTTPSFINELLGENTYSQLSESAYDNLFIVTVYEKGNAEVLHLKYGEPS